MKELLIVANWKSNKTEKEAAEWFEAFNVEDQKIQEKEVIICPPFTLLSFLKEYKKRNNSPFKLGAQNISAFEPGARTGEINALQVKEYSDYVIIGHSERRKMGENDELLQQKTEQAKLTGLKVIYCVSNLDQEIPQGVEIVAYEPLFAIGSGNPDTPENAEQIAEKIKEKSQVKVLYGGSVTSKNISSFTDMENIDGVLVGGASLDPVEFSRIINT